MSESGLIFLLATKNTTTTAAFLLLTTTTTTTTVTTTTTMKVTTLHLCGSVCFLTFSVWTPNTVGKVRVSVGKSRRHKGRGGECAQRGRRIHVVR